MLKNQTNSAGSGVCMLWSPKCAPESKLLEIKSTFATRKHYPNSTQLVHKILNT